LGVEFDRSKKGFQAKLIEECFNNGLLVYPSVGGPEGIDENGILVSPPFIINKTETDELLEKLSRSMAETTRLLKI
jgi:adenosylmethionine-8-amino-7-oxononanoate aminotransferase